jgi:hypothetical protein
MPSALETTSSDSPRPHNRQPYDSAGSKLRHRAMVVRLPRGTTYFTVRSLIAMYGLSGDVHLVASGATALSIFRRNMAVRQVLMSFHMFHATRLGRRLLKTVIR